MSGFASSFSRLVVCVALLGCVDEEGRTTRTTSLRVHVTSPADLGSEQSRIADGLRDIGITVQALDEQGQEDRSLFAQVDVYAHTLGNLTSVSAKVDIKNGNGVATIRMPLAYGKSYLWLEDVTESPLRVPSYATGTSPIIWYREPTIFDVSTPGAGQSMSSWIYRSPLEGKQVRVSGSRFGASGKLVVTGVYASGYAVSDVDCSTGTCVASPWGHVFVFSFGRPVDIRGIPVQVGHTLKWFEGGVVEFNGWTEFNFPTQEIEGEATHPEFLPAPDKIIGDWLKSDSADGKIRLEERESSLLYVENVTICALTSDYQQFQQWRVDVGNGCGDSLAVVTAGQVSGFDPAAYVGRKLTNLTGTLRAVNFSSFSVWILQPRTAADLVLQ